MSRARKIIGGRNPNDATAQNDDSHSCSIKVGRLAAWWKTSFFAFLFDRRGGLPLA
ncbi:hypothetical protein K788_0003402 [Paraburkholderia caribensis MBA4]|uniref:Uncharacterized protein n=1 Tax=Paraburkholderia caribensis MBA4 TaxID=1323664 RepID=A0A0N7JUC3_9BURK|nr:hypothetical protein K788_0003402 [Paraburkholderia caribensis MBA4]